MLIANLAGVVVGLTVDRRAFALPLGYGVATIAASFIAARGRGAGTAARLPLIFATMHHAWAAGFLLGPGQSVASAPLRPTMVSEPRPDV
jgi:hypothetical protein